MRSSSKHGGLITPSMGTCQFHLLYAESRKLFEWGDSVFCSRTGGGGLNVPLGEALPGAQRTAYGNARRSRADARSNLAAANCASTVNTAGSILPTASARIPTIAGSAVATECPAASCRQNVDSRGDAVGRFLDDADKQPRSNFTESASAYRRDGDRVRGMYRQLVQAYSR